MESVYNSELHAFVESYFKIKGASIIEKQENFFIVEFNDGTKETYTYISRIAAENKDITLLAKGSSILSNMIKESTQAAGFSEVDAIYTHNSVKSTLSEKTCCDLCPFFTICENKNSCCDFCPYYRACNTNIINADFIKLGEITKSQPLSILCFVFLVELSNDYSLSQKVEKYVTILIDINTKDIIGEICFEGISSMDITDSSVLTHIDQKEYQGFLGMARQGALDAVKNQLEVFKREIEYTLMDKITSIIDKYEEEYIDNYTKLSLKNLEELQEEALRLCEREISGYAINSDYHLNNVILLHTVRDFRNLTFRQRNTNIEVDVPAEIFLNRVDINCSECNTEIDLGAICNNGHLACKNCIDLCNECNKPICNICDDESYICSTCGELVCSDCYSQCKSCGAILCPSHSYKCDTCGDIFCIDCYEICDICDSTVCKEHANICGTCNSYVCSKHIKECAVCGALNCDNHIFNCSQCNVFLCEEHALKSEYSGKIICINHSGKCSECDGIFSIDELNECTFCGLVVCPQHIKTCSYCNKTYCSKHINHCKACGKDYCDCVQGSTCKLCKETYCPSCVNDKGLCTACENLSAVDINFEEIQDILASLPEVAKCRTFYLGKTEEVNVLYAKNLLGGYLIVYDDTKVVKSTRKVSMLEFLKTKI